MEYEKSIMKTSIFITALALTFVVSLALIQTHQAFALKNLFNCITKASDGGKLSFRDYVNCFNEQFHGQLNGPAQLGDSVKP